MSRESSAKSFWWCWCGISPCSDNWWKHTVNYLSIMLLLFYNKCTHYILYLWWMQLSKQVSKQASSWIGPSSTPEIDTIKGFVSTNSCWNLWCCVLSIKCKTQCGIVEYSNRPHQLFNILWVSMRNIFHRDRILYVCYVIGKSAPANIVRDFCEAFHINALYILLLTTVDTIAAITTVLFLFNCRWLYCCCCGCHCCRFSWKITNIVANRHDFNRTNVQVHTLRLKSLQPNHAYKHKLDTFNCIHSVIGSTTPESSWRSTYIYIF